MFSQEISDRDFFKILQIQIKRNWLFHYNNASLLQLTKELTSKLENFKIINQITPVVLLIESDSLKFIGSLLATIIAKVPVFLGNPNWTITELKQVQQILQPNLIWGNHCYPERFSPQTIISQSHQRTTLHIKGNPIIGIPTGGSSGKIRFAVHTTRTLSASVNGFAEYFETESINSCCTLPLYHVSGLMQLWRSLITQGNLAIVSYKDVKQGIKPDIPLQDYFISLVPTQLQFLLDNDPQWLCQFKTILLGGAPAWRSLLAKARQYSLPIATTYGMTETASGITYVKPQNFLQGNDSSGRVLPHAQVEIINRDRIFSKQERIGTVKITAKSLHYGYYPEFHDLQKPLITDDLGFLDSKGFLHIIGRNSQKIITGGENVYPQEIEAAILATKLVKDVCAIGVADSLWGQAVTAIFVPLNKEVTVETIQQKLKQQLSNYKLPKHWFPTDSLPRDAKGKINHHQLTKIARELKNKQK